jgi:quercetin dioxygenase-like cupin family protein
MTSPDTNTLDADVLDVLGPTIQYVTSLSDDNSGYCVLRGTIPPGVVVPLHSHPDRETFYILAGELEALKDEEWWQTLKAGDVFDVPGGTQHAFRNLSAASVSTMIVTTMTLARFFRKVGRPIATVPPALPSRKVLQRFVQASLAQGHWLGSVTENAAVGIAILSSTDQLETSTQG